MDRQGLLDTHYLVWLYFGEVQHIEASKKDFLNNANLQYSNTAILELEYLFEIGRVQIPANTIINTLIQELHLAVSTVDYGEIIQAALGLKWTRDPFDRLLVAESIAGNIPLLTNDRRITENYTNTIA